MPAKLKYYREAANDNLAYISKKLKKHPDILNEPNPVDDYQTLYHSTVGLGKTFGWGGLSLAGIALIPPIAIFTGIAGTYKMLQGSHESDSHIRSRKNWTLLDYAAEYGASDVAVYLIRQGARTGNGYFRRIATYYDHKDFVTACDMAIADKQEADGKLLQLQNDKALLQEENTRLELKLISYKNKFTKLKVDYLLLYDKTLELLDENDNNTVQDLFDNLKKQHEKILKVHETLGFVASMQQSGSPALKAYAATLYNTLKKDYEQIVSYYAKASEEYKTLSENPAKAASIQKPPTHRFFARTPRIKYAFGLQDRKVPFIAGNCFFDAVIAQCPAKAWTTENLRNEIALELISNDGIYSPAFSGDDLENGEMQIGGKVYPYNGYEEFCALISIDRCYVDDIHIQAFCETQKVCCVIVHANSNRVILQGDKYLTDTTPPVFIGYEDNNHYVALDLPGEKNWKAMLKTINQEGVVTLYDSKPEEFQMKL